MSADWNQTLAVDIPPCQALLDRCPNHIPTVKLRIYAIFVTLVLVAVLTKPSAERHYEKLAQLYPWVKESVLADAQKTVWRLSPPSDQETVAAFFTRMKPAQERTKAPNPEHKGCVDAWRGRLFYTSWGILSLVTTQITDVDVGECATGSGLRLLPQPISLGFLGYVFVKRAPTTKELEKRIKNERQLLLDKVRLPRLETLSGHAKTYTFSSEGTLSVPDGTGAKSTPFHIRGPIMIDTPPRPKDAIYKMESLE